MTQRNRNFVIAMETHSMYQTNMLEMIRRPNSITKGMALLVLAFFLSTFYAPSAKAVQLGLEHDRKQAAIQSSLDSKTSGQKYTELLKEMKGQFKEAQYLYEQQFENTFALKADLSSALKGGSLIVKRDDWKKALDKAIDLRMQASKYHEDVLKSFEADENWAKNAKLSEEIVQRQQESFNTFQERYDAFNELADALEQAPEGEEQIEALSALNEKLGEWQFGRKHQYHDKEQMGSSTPKSAAGAPLLLSKSDYIDKDLLSNPVVKFAANDGFVFDAVPQANDPAYLAETDEIVLTQAIKDKAAELEYKPVEIYNWVRNNIEWIPGWGSYQTAQMTIEVGRGNAMDISSLLIALLRASNIPARYVSGIIEVPEDRYNNWLGNFANADVAIDYGVKAGISTTAVTSGGKITKVRMQHLWVEAAVDFLPSRGANNNEADTWIPLDASFKQYKYQESLDAVAITGLDADALAQEFIDSGIVNQEEGYVQSLDPNIILDAQNNAQTLLENHVTTELTNPTVADVIGGRRAIIKKYPILAAGLPNRLVNKGETYGFLPNALQHRVGLGFGNNGSNNLVFFPMAKLNNEQITLSFSPANETDKDALSSLLPEGEITDVSQLPGFIPSSVNVIPELTLNGEVFTTGSVLGIGHEVDMVYQIISPVATYAAYRYSVIAGSYLNIPVTGYGISFNKLDSLQSTLDNTDTILRNRNPLELNTITRKDLLGDIFYAGGLAYHSQLIGLNRNIALTRKAHHQVAFGYGSYGYEPNLNTFFGITRGINSGGIAFNMRHASISHSINGSREENINLLFLNGLVSSALEHIVSEQMFQVQGNQGEAVSTVKALQIASEEGQKIYRIDANNIFQLDNLSIDGTVKEEIRENIATGRIAIVHEGNITVPGWTGSGYILLDEATGTGSYKISGGFNGGVFSLILLGFSLLLLTFALGLATGGLGFAVAAVAAYQFLFGFKKFLEELAFSGLSGDERTSMLSQRVFLFMLGAISAGFGNLVAGGTLIIPTANNISALALLLSTITTSFPFIFF